MRLKLSHSYVARKLQWFVKCSRMVILLTLGTAAVSKTLLMGSQSSLLLLIIKGVLTLSWRALSGPNFYHHVELLTTLITRLGVALPSRVTLLFTRQKIYSKALVLRGPGTVPGSASNPLLILTSNLGVAVPRRIRCSPAYRSQIYHYYVVIIYVNTILLILSDVILILYMWIKSEGGMSELTPEPLQNNLYYI